MHIAAPEDGRAPAKWAKTAVPFLLKINSADNGESTTVPS